MPHHMIAAMPDAAIFAYAVIIFSSTSAIIFDAAAAMPFFMAVAYAFRFFAKIRLFVADACLLLLMPTAPLCCFAMLTIANAAPAVC